MKKKINIVIILAVVFGLAATYGTYLYLEQMKKTYKSSSKFVTVAIAKEKIPGRQKVTEQMVEFKDIPSNYVNPDAITDKKQVINQVANSDVFPGEQILRSNIISSNDPSGEVAMMIEPGRRAATLAVDPVAGVSGVLKAGDRIDAVVVVDLPDQNKTTIASTFIQNIRILSVSHGLGNDGNNGTPSSQLITLSLSPAEAQQLALATAKGNVRLLLRTPGDQTVTAVPSSQINHLAR